MLRRAFELDLVRYELLGQDARWKRSWRPTYRDQLRVQAFAPGFGAVLRSVHGHVRPTVGTALERARARAGGR